MLLILARSCTRFKTLTLTHREHSVYFYIFIRIKWNAFSINPFIWDSVVFAVCLKHLTIIWSLQLFIRSLLMCMYSTYIFYIQFYRLKIFGCWFLLWHASLILGMVISSALLCVFCVFVCVSVFVSMCCFSFQI